MSRFRPLSPWYWVLLGALVVAGLFLIAHFAFGWGPRWLPLVVMGVVLVSNIFTFRTLWKWSDHPDFHPAKDRIGARPTAPRGTGSDR
jgi:CHASE2 domain-containing sensor protein